MSAVLASSYEPFARNIRCAQTYTEWFIERVPADKLLGREIERWRTMSELGWDVVALVGRDTRTVVALGCR